MRARGVNVIAAVLLALASDNALAQATNHPPVRTSFFRGSALTSQETDAVIELARQCGLLQPESIADRRVFPNLKSVPRSLVVKGAERVEGRKATLQWVAVGSTNWSQSSPTPLAKFLGPFYVDAPYLHTTEVTLFKFGTNTVRIHLSENLSLETADAIFGKFAKRDVRFSRDARQLDWDELDVSESTALTELKRSNDYQITFGSPPRREIRFQYVNGEVIITGIGGRIIY
jgi:hypothetical protein